MHICGSVMPQIMSHQINIPASFEIKAPDRRWYEWRIENAPEKNPDEKLAFYDLPPDFISLLLEHQRRPDVDSPGSAKFLDPLDVLCKFLKLEHSESALLEFLNETGCWDSSAGPHRVGWIWEWQRVFQELIRHPERDWHEVACEVIGPIGVAAVEAYLHFEFKFSKGKCWLEIRPNGTLGALIGTVIIHRALGSKLKVCKRRDCGKTFRLESRHKQKYCCYDCAHLESVRRSRRNNKKRTIRKSRRANGTRVTHRDETLS